MRASLLDRLSAVRPTARGGGFIAAGLAGMLVAYAAGWPALLAVALFLLGAVLAAVVVVVLSPAELEVERRIDPPIAEQRSPVRVRLVVRGRAAGALEWSEELPHSVAVTGHVEGRLPALGAGRPASLLEYELSARTRGAVPIGPLRVMRTDPLRLVAARRRVGGVDRVVVLPRLTAVEPPAALRRTDPDARATAVLGANGDQRDVVAREYRSGDPLRSVDWRATAHRGELMVRTESAASTASTGLVLDTRMSAWPTAAAFEAAVDHTASLVAALEQRDAVVQLVAGRRGDRAVGGVGALVGLATIDRGAADPPPERGVAAAAAGDVRIVHVVTGEGGADALARLPRPPRGTEGVVTVVVQDPGRAALPEVAHGWRVRLLAMERGDPRAR